MRDTRQNRVPKEIKLEVVLLKGFEFERYKII